MIANVEGNNLPSLSDNYFPVPAILAFFCTKCYNWSYSSTFCWSVTSFKVGSKCGHLSSSSLSQTASYLSSYAKHAGYASHNRALKIGFQYLFFALLTLPRGSIQSTVLTTVLTMIGLLPVLYLMAVTDQFRTATVRARFHDGNHGFSTDFTLSYILMR